MKTKIETPLSPLPKTSPFSQAIVVNNFVYTSGQVHLKPDGTMVNGSIEEKVTQVMNNLKNILEAVGTDFSNVVKATVYVTDMAYYGKINEVYSTYFSDPFPAREVVCVKELPLKADVEISLVAYKDL